MEQIESRSFSRLNAQILDRPRWGLTILGKQTASNAGTIFIKGGPESNNRRNPGAESGELDMKFPSAADLGPSGELFNSCSVLIRIVGGVNPFSSEILRVCKNYQFTSKWVKYPNFIHLANHPNPQFLEVHELTTQHKSGKRMKGVEAYKETKPTGFLSHVLRFWVQMSWFSGLEVTLCLWCLIFPKGKEDVMAIEKTS